MDNKLTNDDVGAMVAGMIAPQLRRLQDQGDALQEQIDALDRGVIEVGDPGCGCGIESNGFALPLAWSVAGLQHTAGGQGARDVKPADWLGG
jgi:hypothetical protein